MRTLTNIDNRGEDADDDIIDEVAISYAICLCERILTHFLSTCQSFLNMSFEKGQVVQSIFPINRVSMNAGRKVLLRVSSHVNMI